MTTLIRKTTVYLLNILFIIAVVSCKKEIPVIDKPIKKVQHFNYKGDFVIYSKNLYVGASGENLPFDFSDIKKIWKHIEKPVLPSFITLTKDSILFATKASSINYLNQYHYRMKGDSIIIEGKNASDPSKEYSQFIGIKNANRNIELYQASYYFIKQYEHQINASLGRTIYSIDYSLAFGRNGWVDSPKMLNERDTLAWCNIKYTGRRR